jgi:hypothetical protein
MGGASLSAGAPSDRSVDGWVIVILGGRDDGRDESVEHWSIPDEGEARLAPYVTFDKSH